jgi:hypothetical protein
MRLNHKSALRIAFLLLLAAVVAAMVVPYATLQFLVREFASVREAVLLLQEIADAVSLSHLLSFGLLGFVAHFTSKRWRLWYALGLLTVASTIEVVQIWVPGRQPAISHVILDILGGMGGFGLAWLVAYAWMPMSHREAPSSTWY